MPAPSVALQPERLSLADTAWLRLEMPTNLMMVGSVAFLDRPLDRARLVAALSRRLLVHPRFAERIEPSPLGPPRWVPDDGFDLEAHVHRVALPAPGGDAALRELLGDLMSHPLDMSRPPWDVHLIEGHGDGGVLFIRIHHCVADGTALVQALLGLAAPTAEASLRAPRRRAAQPPGDGHLRIPGVVHPRRAIQRVADAGAHLYTLARLSALWPDPPTSLHGRLVRTKNVAWMEPFPLSDLGTLRRTTGCTVNDILVAAVTGALRTHIRRHDHDVPDHVRALVPVDVRPDPAGGRLGNQFGLVFLDLPVGVAGREDRLHDVDRRMNAARHSAQPAVAFEVLGALGLTPQMLQRPVVRFLGSKATVVVTNARGPEQELYLAGRRLRRLTFFVPQPAGLGVGISIVSYAGRVEMGVIADAGLVADPDAIARDIGAELRAMVAMHA